jgi:hypothetical protein
MYGLLVRLAHFATINSLVINLLTFRSRRVLLWEIIVFQGHYNYRTTFATEIGALLCEQPRATRVLFIGAHKWLLYRLRILLLNELSAISISLQKSSDCTVLTPQKTPMKFNWLWQCLSDNCIATLLRKVCRLCGGQSGDKPVITLARYWVDSLSLGDILMVAHCYAVSLS